MFNVDICLLVFSNTVYQKVTYIFNKLLFSNYYIFNIKKKKNSEIGQTHGSGYAVEQASRII